MANIAGYKGKIHFESVFMDAKCLGDVEWEWTDKSAQRPELWG